MTITTKAMAKVAAVAAGLAMATSVLSLAPVAHAATACTFTRALTVGSHGADVTCLQSGLISAGYLKVAAPTGYFGMLTKAAVAAWQKAAGVSPAVGYFGSISRAAWSGTSGGTTPGPVVTPTGSGLKIMLDPTSPSGTVLVQGQGIGLLARFQFQNPTANPINVTALTFNRTGVSNDSALANIYLYNQGQRITDSAGISSGAFSFSNPSGIFTVPAGGTYTVGVRSDIAGSTSGQQIGINLVSATASAALDPSVSFPVVGGFQTVSAANLASVQYGATVTPSAATSISPQVNYPIWQNTVAVSTNPVKLNSMKFTNLGSISAQYVTNLRLYVDGVQVGTAAPTLNPDGTVFFDLSAAPVSLSTSSHTIKLLSDITGGASRTIVMSVQRSSDSMFVDSQLNQPVTPTNNGGGTFSAQSTGTITINAVNGTTGISTSLDPASPTAAVAVGATNVKWGTFDMLATGENVKVTDLYVFGNPSAGVGGFQNGKVFLNGVQVGSTKSIGKNQAAETDFSMGSSLILPAGVTAKIDIYADAKDTAGTNIPAGNSINVTIDSVANNAQGLSSLQSATVPGAQISSTALAVTASSLTSAKYTGYGNQTVVAGAQNVKLGAFTLSTGSTEGVTVNTIVLTMSSANAASITNLTLKDDATGNTIGTVITTPSTSNTYAVSFDVPVSSTKTIDVFGNILSSAGIGAVQLTVGNTTQGTGDLTGLTASAGTMALQTITIGSGTLSVAAGPNYQTSNNVLAGASAVNAGEWTFTAANSSYTVNNLVVTIPANSASSVTNVTVSYPNASGQTVTATQALVVNTAMVNASATFTGLGMYVPLNSTAALDVSLGIPTIASGATSGASVQVTLDTGAVNTTFQALNSAGTVTTQINSGTAVASAGSFFVRKSIPTFAMVTMNTVTPTTGTPLYKFSISADPAGAIEWTHLVFNIATSASTGTTNLTNVYLVDDSTGTSLMDTNTFASTTGTKATIDLPTNNNVLPKYQQVAAGSTKTYDLYGTVTGWTTGSTLTISLGADTGSVANNTAANLTANNIVWSDRSSTNPVHSITSSDWTNGFLLKNFTSNATTYSK